MPRADALHVPSYASPVAFAALASWALVRVGLHADTRVALGVTLAASAVVWGITRRGIAREVPAHHWVEARRLARHGFVLLALASVMSADANALPTPLWKGGLALAIVLSVVTMAWTHPRAAPLLVLMASTVSIATHRVPWVAAAALVMLAPVAPFPAARLMHDAQLRWPRSTLVALALVAVWLLMRAWQATPWMLAAMVLESIDDDPPPVTALTQAARAAAMLAWGVAAWGALHGGGALGGVLR